MRTILALLLAFAPGKRSTGRGGDEVKDEKAGLVYLLPDGLITRSATPERIEMTGQAAEVFSVLLVITLVPREDQDLEDLFSDMGGDLNGPKLVKNWLCGDKVEKKGGKNTTRLVALARCVGKGPNKTYVLVSIRSTPEDFANLGGLGALQRVGASIKPLGKVRR